MIIDKILRKATHEVHFEYERGTLVSERHLQAILYSEANQHLYDRNIILLIEPKIQTTRDCQITGLIPDMLLVQGNEVVGVVEIKYVPYKYVPYEKDFDTFQAFNSLRNNDSIRIYLKVIANDGNWDKSNSYVISKNLKFYYFAIGNYDSNIFTDTFNLASKYDINQQSSLYTYFILVNNKSNYRQVQFANY